MEQDKAIDVASLSLNDLLDILQDETRDQALHNAALMQLSLQKFDKNNIPERI